LENDLDRFARLLQGRVAKRALPVDRRETRRNQQQVAVAQRDVELFSQMQDHVSAWCGATRFEEAQMPLRDFSVAGQRELAQAAALPPRAQEISDGKRFNSHVSMLEHWAIELNRL